jgi:WD40 repeat protein
MVELTKNKNLTIKKEKFFLFIERYDHRPEDDHMDSIVAITYCDRLKLVATASLDETIKIWNHNCQLLRCIKLRDRPTSLTFCSNSGDLLVGIGNHLFKIYHKLCMYFKKVSS